MPVVGRHAITSAQNPRLKAVAKLRSRRARDTSRTFLVEGFREIRRAVEASAPIRELYYCPSLFLGGNEAALVEAAGRLGAQLVEVSQGAFGKLTYRDRPEGLVAVVEHLDTDLAHLPIPPDALLLVAESIEKPGNLGTMLRAATAAGAHGVIAADPTTDVFNPNVVRASIGTLFCVPTAVAATAEVVDRLRSDGVRIVVATPDAATTFWDAGLSGAVALVVGSEQYGLSAQMLAAADQTVAIPMPGPADSLNAATSAALLLYEALRKRSGSGQVSHD